MYKSIYVPVDNSDHSNRAVACSVALGKAFSAKLVGCHVYAASLHDYRFKQMEYTLPEEYLDEVELERQRKIHDSLITMGLKLISDSYLDGMSKLCRASNLEFEPHMMDGSPQSFRALMTAIELAQAYHKQIETIAVYDPYLHYSVFNGIVNVLTEQAAKVFRFEEQNQLHEEIIDTGLAQIYQSHLEVGERMAAEGGIAVKKTLLDGKPFQKILDH